MFFIVCAFLSACGIAGYEAPAYNRISAEDAFRMMGEADDYLLLDVRTEAEYAELRIEGAVLVPVDEIGDWADSGAVLKKRLILVYCRSGRRSATAAKALVRMGFTNVYDFGGIDKWPYETVGG